MQRKVKARYRTMGPKREKVTITKATIDKDTKSLQQKQVVEEHDCYYVYFPQGHSVRFVGERGISELRRLGYHLRPRLVDMETGDVVDHGGQEYDFNIAPEDQPDADSIVIDEDDEPEGSEPPLKKK